LLLKLVKVARFFEGANQLDSTNEYARRVISAEQIFEPFLKLYNPDCEQQDACDFLNCLLDNLHEELKNFYVP
jgi:ubiquitin C-terminal hydrolase